MNQSTTRRPNLLPIIWLLVCFLLTAFYPDPQQPKGPDAASYSSEVVSNWLTTQLKVTRTTPAPPPFTVRRFAYIGVALYESIVPGLSAYQSLAPQLNGLPALPTVNPTMSYYWPASANAALAAMTRYFYPTTSSANKATIDSLEAANTASYQKDRPLDELTRSAEFGKKIAAAVFDWSKTDGHDNNTAYTLPVGKGLWVSTPPAFVGAALPNWGKCRPMIRSASEVPLEAPITYSEEHASEYYAQVKEVYDISQNLTPEQKAIALFWADDPDGKSFGGGHWMSILNQVLTSQKPGLDVAAQAFAQIGVATSMAGITIFKGKYQYNGMRPVTYIRTVMNQPNWNALIVTPPHPEYPSGHALISSAAAQTLTLLFGSNYKFTDNSYNSLGFSPRTYNSFDEAAIEAGNSRVYGGIHYRKSCDVSRVQGKLIAQNVAQKLKFKRS
ncbi:vanadium-dependent haloperoxidase [Spirosoma endbachense]|uniref:Phosphatase PAP2 family protein n=1 Tax=Spirosoma endbachense TaxID=2666025 RepID=A0A6P1VT99_9BACT|nr:vanadium-dependent haloperoxidase [Spirosoma endbachense]QHV96461.1 phosphatase PAP2 family protein [Spirosoma endbachense]